MLASTPAFITNPLPIRRSSSKFPNGNSPSRHPRCTTTPPPPKSLPTPASSPPPSIPSKPSTPSLPSPLSSLPIPSFRQTLSTHFPTPSLLRYNPSTLQINIGLTCNQACLHCHVASSPARTESMSPLTASRLVHIASLTPSLTTVDITGGAPEMHSQFRYLVTAFSGLGLQVLDRCNLTVLQQPDQQDLIPFLAQHNVKVIASLPCYTIDNVNKQRGNGVFDDSILALQRLNDAGYGQPGSPLELDLVFNPLGPNLPPPQEVLEADYKRELRKAFGIEFSKLICITNMPIKRFADDLVRQNRLLEYMDLLVSTFNPDIVPSVMCRSMVHVAWDGRIYDCDFNYALEMTLPNGTGRDLTVFDIESLNEMVKRPIRTSSHCYGCTAGSGSSCAGSLA